MVVTFFNVAGDAFAIESGIEIDATLLTSIMQFTFVYIVTFVYLSFIVIMTYLYDSCDSPNCRSRDQLDIRMSARLELGCNHQRNSSQRDCRRSRTNLYSRHLCVPPDWLVRVGDGSFLDMQIRHRWMDTGFCHRRLEWLEDRRGRRRKIATDFDNDTHRWRRSWRRLVSGTPWLNWLQSCCGDGWRIDRGVRCSRRHSHHARRFSLRNRRNRRRHRKCRDIYRIRHHKRMLTRSKRCSWLHRHCRGSQTRRRKSILSQYRFHLCICNSRQDRRQRVFRHWRIHHRRGRHSQRCHHSTFLRANTATHSDIVEFRRNIRGYSDSKSCLRPNGTLLLRITFRPIENQYRSDSQAHHHTHLSHSDIF